jgi:hypothetical protein
MVIVANILPMRRLLLLSRWVPVGWSATRKLELRGDTPESHMGSRSTTPLLRNPTEVRHCS